MQRYNSMIGSVLGGRYTLIGIIGIGGMAVVFSAHDRKTGDTVALKMLREDLGEGNTLPNFRSQFSNEARALAELNHSGVVKLYDSHLEKAPYYFVMEYVESMTLKEYLSKKKILPTSEVLDFSMQILSALSHIHSKGIVHCDIKPHNILLMRNGKIKITDFGIARMPGVIPDLPPDQAVGTVYYVSPEQAEGKVLDHRSDLYSLGIMMYQMSSGKLPFQSSDIDRVARMQASAPPKRPRLINPEISKGLEQIILKSLAKKPYMRFESAEEMRSYLDVLRRNPNVVFRLQEKASDDNLTESAPLKYHSHNAYAALLGVALAFAITISAAIPYIHNNIISTSRDEVRLIIPDLKGKTLDVASEKLDEGLYDVEIIYDYSSNKPSGKIVSQSPVSGSAVTIDPSSEQCKVTLTISAKDESFIMEDLTSLSPEEAEEYLRARGFSVRRENAYCDTVSKGLVCSTFPSANTEIKGDTEVVIYVSLGADVKAVILPDFSGKTEAEAAKLIKELGLQVGSVTYKASYLPVGTVLAQSAMAGDEIPVGTVIDFNVSGGADYKP